MDENGLRKWFRGLFLGILIAMFIVVLIWAISEESEKKHLYPAAGEVISVDGELLIRMNGRVYRTDRGYGIFKAGDIALVILDSRGTRPVSDDVIVKVRCASPDTAVTLLAEK